MVDYREMVLTMLTQETSWLSKLAKEIATEDNSNLKNAKFAVSKALKTLQNDELILRQIMKLKDRKALLYYKRDSSMSGLHKFM